LKMQTTADHVEGKVNAARLAQELNLALATRRPPRAVGGPYGIKGIAD